MGLHRRGAVTHRYRPLFLTLLVLTLLIAGCGSNQSVIPPALAEPIVPEEVVAKPPVKIDDNPPTIQVTASETPQSFDTPTSPPAPDLPTPIPTATSLPTITPSPTPNRDIKCSLRVPDNGLLAIVTLTYGLSRDYEPPGLVDLADYLPKEVTLGYPTQLRNLAVGPLVSMITDMEAEGLHPMIISGYRSYSAQAIARQKWAEKEPDRVNILSAPPGFSEHQLGTVIDFGSPELAEIVGVEDIEFHTYFYKTSEGIWLLANAHKYGFTLSYPFEATEVTGFFYEPWHYRYVGVEMATFLREQGTSLTEFQLSTEPPPCIPDKS